MNIFVAALFMFVLEYFVLLKLYRRSQKLQKVSLVVAPLMILVGYYLFKIFMKRDPTLAEYFITICLLELPMAIRGYDIKPDAKVWERMLVAGSFGMVSYGIGLSS